LHYALDVSFANFKIIDWATPHFGFEIQSVRFRYAGNPLERAHAIQSIEKGSDEFVKLGWAIFALGGMKRVQGLQHKQIRLGRAAERGSLNFGSLSEFRTYLSHLGGT